MLLVNIHSAVAKSETSSPERLVETLWSNPNREGKSGRAGIKFVEGLVVGLGVSVDCWCCIVGGTVVAGTVEVFGIAVIGSERRGGA
ncbi:hypothetical protein Tco_0695142 [Tanacetum coccineum]